MPARKKHLAAILLALVCAQLLVPPTLLISISLNKAARQKLIRQKYLEPKFFQELTLTQTQFNNLEFIEPNEFTHHGRLYDLHSVTRINGQYTLLALADDTEALLKEITRKTAQNSDKGHSPLPSSITLLFFEEARPLIARRQPAFHKYPPFKPANIQSPQPAVATPPPDPAC